MARTLLLQDWTTIRGGAGEPVIQSAHDWLDLGGYRDVVFFTQISDYDDGGGTQALTFDTAPTTDEDTFETIVTMDPSVEGTGTNVKVERYEDEAKPLARWVRWQIVSSAAYLITFRVFVVLRAG